MYLTTVQLDRAIGAVMGMATGDAVGAGYEYQQPSSASSVHMKGGGLADFAPGEWTDDTSMAIPILGALASGRDLMAGQTQDDVVREWIQWRQTAKDVGIHTSRMLAPGAFSAAEVAERSRATLASGERCGGNGSLMRTTPIALGYLEALPAVLRVLPNADPNELFTQVIKDWGLPPVRA